MPQPGVPYRPIVAVPQKINKLNPFFAICEDIFFTALDPPRALVAATNLVPKLTTTHSQASTTPAIPSRTRDLGPKETGSTSHTPSAPKPAQTGPGSNVEDEDPGNKNDPSIGSGSGSGKDADPPSNNFPSAADSDPPQGSGSEPGSESSPNGDVKQGSDPSSSDPNIPDVDPGPDADPKSDPQSNRVSTEDAGQGSGSLSPVTSSNTDGNSEQEVGIKPGSQSSTSEDPDRVAASNPDSDGRSGTNSGLAAVDSSDPKDPGYASNAAASSGNPGQGTENNHGKNLVIGNQNAGEAATINGQVAQPLSNNAISIAGTTLTPGASPITVSGIQISLGQSEIAVGSSSVPIATPADSGWIPGQATIIDGQLIQPVSENEVSIAGMALRPGSPALTLSGTPISLGSNALYIGTNLVPLRTELQPKSVITVAGQAFTAAPTGFSIAGTSLAPSQAVTIAGTIVSLDASSHLHIGSSTVDLGEDAASVSPQVVTAAGQVVIVNATAVNVAGVTLAPGEIGITVSGTSVFLDSAGDLVVGSSTFPIETSTGSRVGLMMGGFNSTRPSGTGLTSSVSGVQTFKGGAPTRQNSWPWTFVMLLVSAASVFAGL